MDIDYYDKILAGIAISLFGGASLGFITSIPLQYSFGGGALISIILMYHGMFENGPIGR